MEENYTNINTIIECIKGLLKQCFIAKMLSNIQDEYKLIIFNNCIGNSDNYGNIVANLTTININLQATIFVDKNIEQIKPQIINTKGVIDMRMVKQIMDGLANKRAEYASKIV